MQIQTTSASAAYINQHFLLLQGLKTLISSSSSSQTRQITPIDDNPLIIHSCTINPQPPPQPPSPILSLSSTQYSSPYSDDMLGTESGVYMSPNDNDLKSMAPDHQRSSGKILMRKQQQQRDHRGREYPPTIPLLARTGNLPGHMPWILRRHYINGRLVLKEERVKHHEYFESIRENGRLILHLVPLDDTVTCCHAVCEADEEINNHYDNDEDVELENLGFNWQGDDDDDEYNYDQCDDYYNDEELQEEEEEENYIEQGQQSNYTVSSAFSLPKLCRIGNHDVQHGDPRKCSTYSGGSIFSELSSTFTNGGAAAAEQQLEDSTSSASLAFGDLFTSMPITKSNFWI